MLKFARIILPALLALLLIIVLFIPARIADNKMPKVWNGVLDLASWNGKKAFAIDGQWELYWDHLLTNFQIGNDTYPYVFVNAPSKWSNYEIEGRRLPEKGNATYHIHVTGAKSNELYGIRIKESKNVYRLYVDGVIIAENGNLGDDSNALASAYSPQLASFTPLNESFDFVMQISNESYGIGGMLEPVFLGMYSQVETFDRQLSNVVTYAMTVQSMSCLFFLIFFLAQRREKEALILSVLAADILLRLSIVGDALFNFFPNITSNLLQRLYLLCTPWAEFLLLYFLFLTYGRLVPRLQVLLLLIYSSLASLFILCSPLDITTFVHRAMNYILLLAMALVTFQLIRAAYQGRQGAPLLLFSMFLTTLLIGYGLFLSDLSTQYYLLDTSAFQYMLFVFAQMAVIAMRYRRAHQLEIAHLKGQIRPHFIHNALTSIINISRKDPDRSRELLVDFSSYLRGFYDYEWDEFVPFAQELELVNAYIKLEQARFGEHIRIEYLIEVEDFLIPSLILQPLVENSFVHGLRKKDNGGTVTICTDMVKNKKIRITVRDDGIGLCKKLDQSRSGIGIENINGRLSRLYRTSLVYVWPPSGGCEVYFEIPYKKGNDLSI